MKNLLVTILFCILIHQPSYSQIRVISDCTIIYTIGTEMGSADKELTDALKVSIKTVYIRGNDSRTDLVSPSFSQSLFYDKSTGNVVILREFGNNKFMTQMNNSKWIAENKKYEGMTISLASTESKSILGYICKKGVIQLKDGSSVNVFYSTEMVPSVKEFEYQFKDIPGIVLEFESQEADGKKIKYLATKITFAPIPASRFDIPKSGYRLLN